MEPNREQPKNPSRLIRALLSEAALFVLSFFSGVLLARDIAENGYVMAALLLCLSSLLSACCAALVAHLNLRGRSPFWALGALFGYCAAASFGFSGLMLALLLFFSAASYLLYRLALEKVPRLVVAASLAVLWGLCLVSMFFLQLYQTQGAIDLGSFASSLQSRASDFAVRMETLVLESLPEEQQALLNEDFSTLFSASLLMSLPGLFLSAVFFIGYAASTLFRLLMKTSGVLAILYPEGFVPAPSLVTAAFYGILLVITSLFSSGMGLPAYSAFSALSAVFEMLFAFVGFSALVGRLRSSDRKKSLRSNLWIWALFIMAVVWFALNPEGGLGMLILFLLFFVSAVYPILSYYGLFHTVFAFVKARREDSSDSQKGL